MKRSWFSISLVVVLLGLLGLLATLQYRWQGQISDSERDRLQKRLQIDTERFADDFNNEIRKAYFHFQLDVQTVKQKNWQPFNEQLEFWKKNSTYPGLVSEFYFIGRDDSALAYDPASKNFTPAALPDEIAQLSGALKKDEPFEPVMENVPALVMPVYEDIERIASDQKGPAGPSPTRVRMSMEAPRKKAGFFVIKLDKKVIEGQIFPALTQQYFSGGNDGGDGANYRLSVVSQKDGSQVIFKNHPDEMSTASDSSAKLFSLSPEKMAFFLNRDLVDSLKRTPHEMPKEHGNVVFTQKFETKNSVTSKIESAPGEPGKPAEIKERTFNLQVAGNEKPRVTVMESKGFSDEGVWTLNVQHRDGSLEQFVTNTRNRNLAVSFGILSLLGISIGLIFLSAQRAKSLAQRQMDFVSSVSHEFRTPLAVIYTAGENLTDGVVNSHNQVTEYGTLIKHEGKKLSAMVEQILEFAGARSGKRKYDLRRTSIELVLDDALAECQPLLNQSGFEVEKTVQPGLPEITADGKALSHAFQNLINNAIKYSRDDKRLKIAAENGGGTIKLSFEDRGRGISARERSHIFEPFYRGKEVVEAQIHGNGLGLSLVKQIVEAHNGRVDVESRLGEGSKFTVKLPI